MLDQDNKPLLICAILNLFCGVWFLFLFLCLVCVVLRFGVKTLHMEPDMQSLIVIVDRGSSTKVFRSFL